MGPKEPDRTDALGGWRLPAASVNLPEVHRSIAVAAGAGFWREFLAFAGPGCLVAVGYMDQAAGPRTSPAARFGYTCSPSS